MPASTSVLERLLTFHPSHASMLISVDAFLGLCRLRAATFVIAVKKHLSSTKYRRQSARFWITTRLYSNREYEQATKKSCSEISTSIASIRCGTSSWIN